MYARVGRGRLVLSLSHARSTEDCKGLEMGADSRFRRIARFPVLDNFLVPRKKNSEAGDEEVMRDCRDKTTSPPSLVAARSMRILILVVSHCARSLAVCSCSLSEHRSDRQDAS